MSGALPGCWLLLCIVILQHCSCLWSASMQYNLWHGCIMHASGIGSGVLCGMLARRTPCSLCILLSRAFRLCSPQAPACLQAYTAKGQLNTSPATISGPTQVCQALVYTVSQVLGPNYVTQNSTAASSLAEAAAASAPAPSPPAPGDMLGWGC